MNKLIHGDCLEEMGKLAKDGVKIDCIIADPPYGHKTTSQKWDSVIPLDKMWECINKLSHEKTTVVLFGKEPFSSKLRLSNIKEYRYDWIWQKPRGSDFLHAKCRPMSNYEIISVFSKASSGSGAKNKMVYNPQFTYGKPSYHNGTDKPAVLFKSEIKGKPYHNHSGIRYPKRILEFDNYFGPNNKIHPTQKPLDLLEYLVNTHTNEGDLILDFCMGSGSTCHAAKNLNRKYIGIEKEEEYYEIAAKRLNTL